MAIATAGTYAIDITHSEVAFSVRHLMSKVRGKFEEFEGSFVLADPIERSSVSATIKPNSINTGTPDRDNHLRSADFFEVEKHPEWTFTSTSVKADGDDFIVTGDLTIVGVTKSVDLKVEFMGEGGDPWGGSRIGVEATTEFSRKDFGVEFNIPMDGGKLVIGDKITVAIAAEGVLQTDEA